MNTLFLKKYIQNLTKNDIQIISSKKNIKLNPKEIDNIYYYIKRNYQKYFNKQLPKEIIIKDIKDLVTKDNYIKIYNIYNENKDKI